MCDISTIEKVGLYCMSQLPIIEQSESAIVPRDVTCLLKPENNAILIISGFIAHSSFRPLK